jgi:hypothetical protein
MKRPILLATLAEASLAPVEPVFAHGFAGPHMFISTLQIDDPNVADDASLPTFSFLPQPNGGGTTPGLRSRIRQFQSVYVERNRRGEASGRSTGVHSCASRHIGQILYNRPKQLTKALIALASRTGFEPVLPT